MRWTLLILTVLAFGCEDRSTPPVSPTPSETPHVSCCLVPTTQPLAASREPTATTQPATQPAETRASPWIEPGQREQFDLSFRMTDQDGKEHRLSDLINKPTAITFIYTRCPDPKMCPATTLRMANLQHAASEAGLGSQVQLALISYDPAYDTPARLKRWGDDHGIRFSARPHVLMLRPRVDEFRDLLTELQIDLMPQADGSFLHRVELILVDRQGRYVRDYLGGTWDNASVAADLKKLADERAQ
ncbi:MAG: SCO family protein [Phycisphaeraceae bacterium]|nr:SCO family protein [Phycisphaeraceae bacterium]